MKLALIGVVVSILLAFALAGGWGAFLLFILIGLAAGLVAQAMPPGSERVYWASTLILLLLILANLFGVALNRYLFILPIVFVLSYFATRLVGKFMGLKRA